jgi:hypothetical protein
VKRLSRSLLDEIARILRDDETRNGETRIACAFFFGRAVAAAGCRQRGTRRAGGRSQVRTDSAARRAFTGSSVPGQDFAVRDHMKTNRWVVVLVALVLMPAALLWGAFLLIPAALLLVPAVLLAAIAAVPALLVAATSKPHDTASPQQPVSTTPVYTST